MAAVASLQFTQGANTDVAGRAVVGDLTSGVCNVANGDNTDVASWEIELLYSPPGSALVPGVLASAVSNTPAANFTPDVTGCYRIRLRVFDTFGVVNEDIRNFGVPNFRGIIVPPYQNAPLPIDVSLKDDELNFSGQAFGWAGDRVVGLFEKYFETDRDVATLEANATPVTVGVREADVYLINTNTIASASQVDLPAGARNGQVFTIADNEGDAFTYNIRVELPGGETFQDGTSTRFIFANGGLIKVMKLSGTNWRILENTNREDFIDLFGGTDSTSNTGGFDRVSSKQLDVSRFPTTARFVFEAIMETTNVANAHTVRIFNITDAVVVSTPLSSTSLTPEQQSDTLLIPTDLPSAAPKLYELQHQMAAGVGPDEVTISGAHLRVVYAMTG